MRIFEASAVPPLRYNISDQGLLNLVASRLVLRGLRLSSDTPRLLAALTGSPRKEAVLMQSRDIRSGPCESYSPHGYLGIEGAARPI
jgi:hypothetical protein